MFVLYGAREAHLLLKLRLTVLKSDSTGALPALTKVHTSHSR